MEKTLREIPMNRTMLESDAPFQIPKCYIGISPMDRAERTHGLVGHPFMLGDIARMMADITLLPYRLILRESVKNAKQFYGI